MGFQLDGSKFFLFASTIVVATHVGASMLLFFSSISKTLDQSNLLATFFLILFMLFDGNWISIENIPPVYRWIRHFSFMGYALENAAHTEFTGLVSIFSLTFPFFEALDLLLLLAFKFALFVFLTHIRLNAHT